MQKNGGPVTAHLCHKANVQALCQTYAAIGPVVSVLVDHFVTGQRNSTVHLAIVKMENKRIATMIHFHSSVSKTASKLTHFLVHTSSSPVTTFFLSFLIQCYFWSNLTDFFSCLKPFLACGQSDQQFN